jgi:hypothetical protein
LAAEFHAGLERRRLVLTDQGLMPVRLKASCGELYSSAVRVILALAVLMFALVGCRGPGGPAERAGRAVDNAVYDVGTGIKKAGQKIQQAAE